MWLSKPLYEFVPYFYLIAGVGSLLASLYVNHWRWPLICTFVGLACLVVGLVVWLKRRDYRQSRSRAAEITDELG
jgi:hypothetical protein